MLVWRAGWRPVVLPKFLPTIWGLTVAYAERRERKKGVRYRGLYKAADGRYRSASRRHPGTPMSCLLQCVAVPSYRTYSVGRLTNLDVSDQSQRMPFAARGRVREGHQNLPSEGREVDAMAITESDRIRLLSS
jgi:hypothetical protein